MSGCRCFKVVFVCLCLFPGRTTSLSETVWLRRRPFFPPRGMSVFVMLPMVFTERVSPKLMVPSIPSLDPVVTSFGSPEPFVRLILLRRRCSSRAFLVSRDHRRTIVVSPPRSKAFSPRVACFSTCSWCAYIFHCTGNFTVVANTPHSMCRPGPLWREKFLPLCFQLVSFFFSIAT